MNLSCTSRHIYNIKTSSSSKPTTAILLVFLLLNEIDKESTWKTCRDAQNSSFSGGHKQCMHSEQFDCNTHSPQMIFRSPIMCESWTGSQHVPFADVFSLSSTSSCSASKRIKPVFLFMSPWYHLLVSPKMKTWVVAFLTFGITFIAPLSGAGSLMPNAFSHAVFTCGVGVLRVSLTLSPLLSLSS